MTDKLYVYTDVDCPHPGCYSMTSFPCRTPNGRNRPAHHKRKLASADKFMNDGFEPGRIWRLSYQDSVSRLWKVWCESSDEQEVRRSARLLPSTTPTKLSRYYEKREWKWVDQ